mmetsp:Transcript_29749/g.79165  ORF Transcript_29749/g.79165 Transcript_29749/m.79165 type:complete len:115 (+) Transcript_29749:10-354(+)
MGPKTLITTLAGPVISMLISDTVYLSRVPVSPHIDLSPVFNITPAVSCQCDCNCTKKVELECSLAREENFTEVVVSRLALAISSIASYFSVCLALCSRARNRSHHDAVRPRRER